VRYVVLIHLGSISKRKGSPRRDVCGPVITGIKCLNVDWAKKVMVGGPIIGSSKASIKLCCVSCSYRFMMIPSEPFPEIGNFTFEGVQKVSFEC
jgi:hypothetical protein